MKVTGARNDRIPVELVTGDGGVLVLKDAPDVEVGDGNDWLNVGLAKIERDKQEFMDAIESKFAMGVFLTASPASPKGVVEGADAFGWGRGCAGHGLVS